MHKTIRDFNFKGKRALVRCDFNVPLDENGQIKDDFRIRQTLPTINYLLEKRAKIILMSHLGDPEGKFVESLRLTSIQDRLMECLDLSIVKASDWDFKKLREWTLQMQPTEILLLENLRFHPGEEENSEQFAKNLASLGDIYLNDAFGTSHREHASIVGVPKYLPSGMGMLLEKEIEALNQVVLEPKRPLVAIMGGAKVATKIKLMEKLLTSVDHLLVGGVLANTILKAKGLAVGKSIIDEKMVEHIKKMEITSPKLHLPLDVVTARGTSTGTPTAVRAAGAVKEDELIFDIGPETCRLFGNVIKEAKVVFWNGPVGYFEKEPFDRGTEFLAKTIAQGKCFSIVGGGDVASILEKLKLSKKISHISTGGGAMLQFLSGEKLPGIEALESRK